MHEPRILVFEAYSGGHRELYAQMLLSYWVRHDLQGELHLAVSPSFVESSPAIQMLVTEHGDRGLRLSTLEGADELSRTAPNLLWRDRLHGRLIRQAIADCSPDHCLLMFWDHAQISLWRDLRFDYPIRISGLYFRPSFHYGEIGCHPESLKERVKRSAKKWLLARSLSNPHVDTLFSLDPFAVPAIEALSPRTRVLHLPDGVDMVDEDTAEPAAVESSRRVTALLFGGLTRRKGLLRVLESVHFLSSPVQNALRIELVGVIPPCEREEALVAIEKARSQTSVEIYVEDAFVSPNRLRSFVRSADVILAAYQRHVGSSNVLVQAAAAGKPVIGSDYGLVGEQIRRNRLGVAVDSTSAALVADALSRFVKRGESVPFDPGAARAFAVLNSADACASTIFKGLGIAV